MTQFLKNNFILYLGIVLLVSCDNDDNYKPVTPVVLDITQVPYPKLSDYHFFDGNLNELNPAYGVLPYKPASELFTDYTIKKRFVWMPIGSKATYNGDENILNLPVGAALIKNFYYNNVLPNNVTKIIETRVLIRKNDGWIFAEYIWNNEQTEAFLNTESTEQVISFTLNNTTQTINYKTPSSNDCNRCHGDIFTLEKNPIGIKPQNLNHNFIYADGTKNQLAKWIDFGYLENSLPSSIVSTVDYKDTSKAVDLRVRSYFDANCAHCHKSGGDADHFALRFAFNETIDNEKMGVGLQAEHVLVGYNGRIVSSGNVAQSILHYRVNTVTDMVYIMPPIGRSTKDDIGVQLVEDWINSL